MNPIAGYDVKYRPAAFKDSKDRPHNPVLVFNSLHAFDHRSLSGNHAEGSVFIESKTPRVVNEEGVQLFVTVLDSASRRRCLMELIYEFEQFIIWRLGGSVDHSARTISDEPRVRTEIH